VTGLVVAVVMLGLAVGWVWRGPQIQASVARRQNQSRCAAGDHQNVRVSPVGRRDSAQDQRPVRAVAEAQLMDEFAVAAAHRFVSYPTECKLCGVPELLPEPSQLIWADPWPENWPQQRDAAMALLFPQQIADGLVEDVVRLPRRWSA